MLRIGRLQLSLEGLLLVAGLMAGAAWLGSCGARGDGARVAEVAALKLENDSLRRQRARVDTVFRIQRDTFYLRRQRVDTLTQTVELWKRDTLRVVEYVQRADSALRACSALVLTCERRAEIADRESANLRRQVRLLEQGTARAWTAAGLSYEASTGEIGAWVERDLFRGRGGIGITPGVNGLRVELRGGLRW